MSFETVQECANYIKERHAGDIPEIAIVLGSGLGKLADSLSNATIFTYDELPGFPPPLVEGHHGRLLIGELEGTPVMCLQGRVHAYEGHEAPKLAFATRTMWALGAKHLILTNAAGSLRAENGPGSLMAISDHINLSGMNPLVGVNDDRFGPRFVDMTHAWDKEHLALLKDTACELSIPLGEGVYLMVKGPNFESPAEIRAFRTMGADAVGMSTIPECLAANHCGMRVVGISTITNLAAGMTGEALSHDETIEFAAKGADDLIELITNFVARIG